MPANKKQPPSGATAQASGVAEDEISFEEALERLETIVEELEGGSLSLEQSLARYEEGMRLSRRLTQTLDQAEKRIERLVEEGGTPTTRTLERDPGERDPGEQNHGRGGRPTEGGEGELPF